MSPSFRKMNECCMIERNVTRIVGKKQHKMFTLFFPYNPGASILILVFLFTGE